MNFASIKEGLQALTCEDDLGTPCPMMSLVNADSITKFQNLLVQSNKARVAGDKFIIEESERGPDRSWLYQFIKQTGKRNVHSMVSDQVHYNTLYEKISQQFASGTPLSFKRHMAKHELSSPGSRAKKSGTLRSPRRKMQ